MLWVCLKAGGIPPIYGQFDRENESVGIGDFLRASPGKTWTYQLPCQTSAGVGPSRGPKRAPNSHRFFDLAAALANIQMPEDLKPQKPPGRPRARRPTAPAQVTWLGSGGFFHDFHGFFSQYRTVTWFEVSTCFIHFHQISIPCLFSILADLTIQGWWQVAAGSHPKSLAPSDAGQVQGLGMELLGQMCHDHIATYGWDRNGKYTHDQDIPR